MLVVHTLAAVGVLLSLLTAAVAQDAERGKALFEQCVTCHLLQSGQSEAGPHLHKLFGRRAAAVDTFVYSPPMRRSNFVWTPELLDAFLKEPQSGQFRGNRMPFAGMPDATERADLVAYLKQATQ